MKKFLIFIIGILFFISCNNKEIIKQYQRKTGIVYDIEYINQFDPVIQRYISVYRVYVNFEDTSKWITLKWEPNLGDTIYIYNYIK